MANLTSSLTVKLIDDISGPAKNATKGAKGLDAALKGIKGGGALPGLDKAATKLKTLDKQIAATAKAAQHVSAAQPFRGFSEQLTADLSAMRLSRREARILTRDYIRMGREQEKALGGLGAKAREQIIAKDSAQIEQRVRDRAKLMRAEQQLTSTIVDGARAQATARRLAIQEQRRFSRDRGQVVGRLGAVAGVGVGAYGAGRAGRYAIRAGAQDQREGARDYLAGLTPEETARIKGSALSLSSQYRSVDATTLHERLRDTALSMGSLDKAMEVADTIAKASVVLQSLKGKDAAIEEGRRFFAALDNLGKNTNGPEVQRLMNGWIKALGVEGADLDMGSLLQIARKAKSAGGGLNERFLTGVAPALSQDMGPEELGTALGTGISQVIGGRATAKSKNYQRELGLRDKKGNFRNRDQFVGDPFEYSEKTLIPALQKKGIDITNDAAVIEAMSKAFSQQTVANMFTKMIQQREQYNRKLGQYDKAPGIEAADKLPNKDPFVAAAGAQSQFNNTLAIFSDQWAPAATSAMNSLSGATAALNKSMLENPDVARNVAGKGALLGIPALSWLAGEGMKKLAGDATGLWANATRMGGGALSTGGRIATKGAAPLSLLSTILDLIGASGRQFGYGGSQGPGSKGHAQRLRSELDTRYGTPDPAGARRTELLSAIEANKQASELLESNVLGGAFRTTRRAALGKDLKALTDELTTLDGFMEQRRESARGHGFGGFAAYGGVETGTAAPGIPLPPARPEADNSSLLRTKEVAAEAKDAVNLLNMTVHPTAETGSLSQALTIAKELLATMRAIPGAAQAAASASAGSGNTGKVRSAVSGAF